jgi:uncharacterized protein (DUF488 family)
MHDTIFTIGHSNHPQEHFIHLLQQHAITALCDVRSKPYSRMCPQFNRDELEQALPEHGIEYRFLGKELGGRSEDAACYEGGRIQYERLAETELFRYGLKRLLSGLKQNLRIAVMCAEKEPLECHRTILVARQLAAVGLNVEHIDAEGYLENHAAALNRLREMLHLPDQDLFHSPAEMLAEAYRRQEERIAYETAFQAKSAAG